MAFFALCRVGALGQSSADSVAPMTNTDSVVEAGPIYIEPLFEYPSAPDDLKDLRERANWLLENFWKSFDFTKSSVSQAALDHAFSVYVAPLRWADPQVVEVQISDLVKTLSKYPPMLLQFTKAAENNLYSDKASMWVDGTYMKFLDALLDNKKINDLRKARYKEEHKLLSNAMIGGKMPTFDYVTPSGVTERLNFTTPYTVVIFGDPFCSECAMYKIAIESMTDLQQMIVDGKLNIYYIIPDGDSVENWQMQLARYPSYWKRGAGKLLDEVYDMRQQPSVYLLDGSGVIVDKYIATEALRNYLTTHDNTSDK